MMYRGYIVMHGTRVLATIENANQWLAIPPLACHIDPKRKGPNRLSGRCTSQAKKGSIPLQKEGSGT